MMDFTPLQSFVPPAETTSDLSHEILEAMSDAVIVTDSGGGVRYLNPAAELLLGYRLDEVFGWAVSAVATMTEIRDFAPGWLLGKRAGAAGHVAMLTRRNGDQVAVHVGNGSLSSLDFSYGRITVLRDITTLYTAARRAVAASARARLPRLLNRRELEGYVEKRLVRAHVLGLHSLVCMEIERLGAASASVGQAGVDELLGQVAELVWSNVRGRDVCARIGDNRLLIVMEQCPLTSALQAARLVRNALHTYRFAAQGRPFRLGVCIGLVQVLPAAGESPVLLAAAEQACDAACAKGSGTIWTQPIGVAGNAMQDLIGEAAGQGFTVH